MSHSDNDIRLLKTKFNTVFLAKKALTITETVKFLFSYLILEKFCLYNNLRTIE